MSKEEGEPVPPPAELVRNFADCTRLALLGMLDTVAGCDLSQRQREVLAMAALGKTSRETGQALGIHQRTAETHIQRAMKKLNAQSISQAVFLAAMLGLLFTDY